MARVYAYDWPRDGAFQKIKGLMLTSLWASRQAADILTRHYSVRKSGTIRLASNPRSFKTGTATLLNYAHCVVPSSPTIQAFALRKHERGGIRRIPAGEWPVARPPYCLSNRSRTTIQELVRAARLWNCCIQTCLRTITLGRTSYILQSCPLHTWAISSQYAFNCSLNLSTSHTKPVLMQEGAWWFIQPSNTLMPQLHAHLLYAEQKFMILNLLTHSWEFVTCGWKTTFGGRFVLLLQSTVNYVTQVAT